MSNKKKNYTKPDVEITETAPVEEVVETVEANEEVAPVEVKEEVAPVEVKKGVVVNCAKLNIRKKPRDTAPVIGTLNAGDTVIIHGEIRDFYKIGNPEIGEYCMKKYISIQK